MNTTTFNTETHRFFVLCTTWIFLLQGCAQGNRSTGAPVVTLNGHKDWVSSIAFSPNGTMLASASGDSCVKVWDVASWKERLSLSGHDGTVYCVKFSPEGARLLTGGSDGSLRVWDVLTGNEQMRISAHNGRVWACDFARRGTNLVSAGGVRQGPGELKVWDSFAGHLIAVTRDHKDWISSIGISADGTLVASGGLDSTVRVREMGDIESNWQRTLKDRAVTCVSFLPDGGVVASANAVRRSTQEEDVRTDKAVVIVCNADGNGTSRTLATHACKINCLAVSPSGKTIAFGGSDGTIHLLEIASGRCVAAYAGHNGAVYGIAYAPGGAHLASGCADGTVNIWNVNPNAH